MKYDLIVLAIILTLSLSIWGLFSLAQPGIDDGWYTGQAYSYYLGAR